MREYSSHHQGSIEPTHYQPAPSDYRRQLAGRHGDPGEKNAKGISPAATSTRTCRQAGFGNGLYCRIQMGEIGRASCRERVEISGVGGAGKKKNESAETR